MTEKSFNNPSRTNKLVLPKGVSKSFFVNEFHVMNRLVVTLEPKNQTNNNHIVFLHGGAYLLEGSKLHWSLIEKIAQQAHCTISYIDYPLAPEFSYISTFEMLEKSYSILTNLYASNRFIFMGDSAGGGLALAFAQKLANEKSTIQPIKNILFSPWLDISMQNPALKNLEKFDKLLPLSGLVIAGKKYASKQDVSHYLLSPIHGNCNELGKTLVFYGTHELFCADCKKLKIMTANNENFRFYEFQKMQHDWVLFPIPEAKQAIQIAVNFIND